MILVRSGCGCRDHMGGLGRPRCGILGGVGGVVDSTGPVGSLRWIGSFVFYAFWRVNEDEVASELGLCSVSGGSGGSSWKNFVRCGQIYPYLCYNF